MGMGGDGMEVLRGWVRMEQKLNEDGRRWKYLRERVVS